jgi:hypothetical protein
MGKVRRRAKPDIGGRPERSFKPVQNGEQQSEQEKWFAPRSGWLGQPTKRIRKADRPLHRAW